VLTAASLVVVTPVMTATMMPVMALMMLVPVLATVTMVVPMARRCIVITMHRAAVIMVHDAMMIMAMARDRGTNGHAHQATQQGIFTVGLGRTCHHQSCRQGGDYQNFFHSLLL
jgi:hypothetical protein